MSQNADGTNGGDAKNDIADLNKRLDLIKKKIEIAESYKQLTKLASEFPDVDILTVSERDKVSKLSAWLASEMKVELEVVGVECPDSINIDKFSQEWIGQNGARIFSHLKIDETLPKSTVEIALRDLLSEGCEIDETREELLEINRKSPWFYHPYIRRLAKKVKNIRDSFWIIIIPLICRIEIIPERWKIWLRSKIEKLKADVYKRKKNMELRRKIMKSSGSARRAKEMRDTRRQHSIQQIVTSWSFFFTGMSAFFMLVMLLVGGMTLGYAVINVYKHKDNLHHGLHEAMSIGLTALELILLAPLPYLLVLGLMRYIKALAFQERADEFRRELLEFKAFEVALFIAIIAAAVVSKVLKNDLNLGFAAAVTIIIAVLSGYYFIIEKAAKEAAEDERK
ncbi:MAG: hypothetical protein ABL934_17930 [Lysobacteraceae bacterium]